MGQKYLGKAMILCGKDYVQSLFYGYVVSPTLEKVLAKKKKLEKVANHESDIKEQLNDGKTTVIVKRQQCIESDKYVLKRHVTVRFFPSPFLSKLSSQECLCG